VTGGIAIITAVSSAWLILEPAVHCDSLAPLTVLATLAAFLISICFRQMGRFPDKRSRWVLLVFLLIAAGTLFADFRYVRKYRNFCDELQQQIRPAQPNH
jgi:glucan phosphoethanolaminetransferase (alkaline phosphatase superfamily)